jgi:50S ribosomal protein L16 3-hydroxylase
MKLNLNIDNFLAEYWQKKPLLIRNAIDNFTPPIDANELAGLAMEDDVESRIIDTLPDNWQLNHGPFKESAFERKYPWTLLVQATDHHVQNVADLLSLVNFIPKWRVDDVMVSYAIEGGSVGPHYDNYDVFLLQGEGNRRWQLGQSCDSDSALLPNPDLRILADFDCTQEYVLEPGDMLYVPPGVAHWGIAQGECTTFSLGFRAPRIIDMLSRWVDEILESSNPEIFYEDSNLTRAARAGEIRPEDLSRVTKQLAAALAEKSSQRWFGELVTEPRYDLEFAAEEIEFQHSALDESCALVSLLPSSKLAWIDADRDIDVYANGNSQRFSAIVRPTVIELCENGRLEGQTLDAAMASPEDMGLLRHLITLACISVE